MRKKTVQLFPDTIKILEQMGEQIKLARLRRNLSVGACRGSRKYKQGDGLGY